MRAKDGSQYLWLEEAEDAKMGRLINAFFGFLAQSRDHQCTILIL